MKLNFQAKPTDSAIQTHSRLRLEHYPQYKKSASPFSKADADFYTGMNFMEFFPVNTLLSHN
ncbi:hypothetical protein DWY69_21160 [Eisenbergiella massiliensis]|uniref:Uncharacterized protein n=1 Tax=Eisenbergiella massiliensis TaxID=1720294 RepID=A0A3E3ILG1_9FIRM|nr:hypothetical protein DWY69_21160 [Eisenbergiella massiliensis]